MLYNWGINPEVLQSGSSKLIFLNIRRLLGPSPNQSVSQADESCTIHVILSWNAPKTLDLTDIVSNIWKVSNRPSGIGTTVGGEQVLDDYVDCDLFHIQESSLVFLVVVLLYYWQLQCYCVLCWKHKKRDPKFEETMFVLLILVYGRMHLLESIDGGKGNTNTPKKGILLIIYISEQ